MKSVSKKGIYKNMLLIIAAIVLYYLIIYLLQQYKLFSKGDILLTSQLFMIIFDGVVAGFCFALTMKTVKLWRLFFISFGISRAFNLLFALFISFSFLAGYQNIIIVTNTGELLFRFIACIFIVLQIIQYSRSKWRLFYPFYPSILTIIFAVSFLLVYNVSYDGIGYSATTHWILIKSCYDLSFFLVLLFIIPIIRNLYLSLLIFGLLSILVLDILTPGDSFAQSNFQFINPGYFFWVFGKVLVVYAIVNIYYKIKHYSKRLFYSVDSTRTQIIYWGNSVALSFFLLLEIHDTFVKHSSHFIWQAFAINLIVLVPFVSLFTFLNIFFSNLFSGDYKSIKFIVSKNLKSEEGKSFRMPLMHFFELAKFAKILRNRILILNKKKDIQKRMFTIATRAAHDIQTPLTVLGMLSEDIENKMPSKEKAIFEESIVKIKGIAQDLLNFRKESSDINSASSSYTANPQFIGIDIVNLLRKRLPHAQISCSRNLRFALSQHCPTTLMKQLVAVVSALSADIEKSLKMSLNFYFLDQQPMLKISLSSVTGGYAFVKHKASEIIDHESLKLQLMLCENKKELSLHVAIDLVSPPWKIDHFSLSQFNHIIIFDDESVYHDTWDLAFAVYFKNDAAVDVSHCYNEDQFLKAINSIDDQTLILIDYDIKGSPLLGVDYIKQFALNKYAILVTNHFNDARVQNICRELKIHLLPKPLIPHILA